MRLFPTRPEVTEDTGDRILGYVSTDFASFTVDAMLCDSATLADGKLYVQGAGWNLISSSQFPFVQARIGLALVIGVPYTATNDNHELRIRLETEDGELRPLGPPVGPPSETGENQRAMMVGAQFNVGRPPMLQPGDRQNLPFAVNFDQIEFEAAGAYAFALEMDGAGINRLPFRVVAAATLD
jgi:hypothetical protein